jgi:hypothetical protein
VSLFDEMSEGVRARIQASAKAANMTPAAWLRKRGLKPEEFGYVDLPPPPQAEPPQHEPPPPTGAPSRAEINAIREQFDRFIARRGGR